MKKPTGKGRPSSKQAKQLPGESRPSEMETRPTGATAVGNRRLVHQ